MGNRSGCCDRVCKAAPEGHDFLDDSSSCDPAGAVFHETLEDLNEVDRLLLLFCSSSNLAAVRWLCLLRASLDACDTNGTTCLHAACRSGSLEVVQDLIDRRLPLGMADVAGWQPLHVATFMGRRSVALRLMKESEVELRPESLRGQTPADLCSDAWLREAISQCAAHRDGVRLAPPWGTESRTAELTDDAAISSRLRFEPFFVPRPAVVKDAARILAFQRLGVSIFNNRPGQGLAFLVATGSVRDYPIELSSFIMENSVDPSQVGEFLGEDFSLSQTLRLEFINTVQLAGTGVVSCLAKVFNLIHIPSDMRKIDRLVEGIAQIWWRQHERLLIMGSMKNRSGTTPPNSQRGASRGAGHTGQPLPLSNAGHVGARGEEEDEVEGLALMQLVAGHCALHQLMFSAILLHWNLYAPLPPSERLSVEQWLELNVGLGTPLGGGEGESEQERADVVQNMERMHRLIYVAVSRCFFEQLQIWSADAPQASARGGDSAKRTPWDAGVSPARTPRAQRLDVEQAEEGEVMEGWCRLVEGWGRSYRHVRSIHSEMSGPVHAASPANSRPFPEAPVPATSGDGLSGSAGPGAIAAAMVISGSSPQALKATAPGAFLESSGLSPASAPPLWSLRDPAKGDGQPGFGFHAEPPPVVLGAGPDRVWATLRSMLLLFARKPSRWAPYAFAQLHGVQQHCDARTFTIVLTAAAPDQAEMADGTPIPKVAGPVDAPPPFAGAVPPLAAVAPPPVKVIFLLPDGRWQKEEVPRIEIQLPDARSFDRWRSALASQCLASLEPGVVST